MDFICINLLRNILIETDLSEDIMKSFDNDVIWK